MTEEERMKVVQEKVLQIGKFLEGIPIYDVLWILNKSLYGVMHQMFNAPPEK